MRDFVDAILAFIGTASLNDDEFELIEETAQSYTAELYADMLEVLDEREAISSVRDQLTAYFTARGVEVTASSAGTSKILIGDDLCS
jgi:hypothetical protein